MQNLSTGTMSHRILLVDDEIDILEFVRYNLLKEGYEVFTAQNGAEALKAAAECRPHLILLDMMMPVMDGAQTCRAIREDPRLRDTMVVFLSALGEEEQQLTGFGVGADDYLTKPFGTGELLARVRVALRLNRYSRTGDAASGGEFQAQGLRINYDRRKVFVEGQEVRLTQTEYNIVAFLSEHAGRVMTYAAIVRAIWGDTDASSTKKLQVNMANIRKKLGSRPGSNTYILNELGVGYRMIEEDAKPLEPAEETK